METLKKLAEMIVSKGLGGRFLLTIAGAIVFVRCSLNGILPKEAVATILAMIFTLYFSRNDRNGNGKSA